MLEVDGKDNIAPMKQEQRKLGEAVRRLQIGGCLFIHKKETMDDEQSFEWHN